MILLSNLAFDCSAAPVESVASFWRSLVGYSMAEPSPAELAAALAEHPEWAGLAVVDEEPPGRRHPRLFLQTVPEGKVGRNRVRPVVCVPGGEAGADEGGERRDVEGNEYRVVDGPVGRFVAVEIDAVDPERQAASWSSMLGFSVDGTTIHPPAAWLERVSLFPSFSFVASAEPKSVKNRIHFDFLSDDPAGDFRRLVALGCGEVVRHDDFVTMQDAEGNEFDLPA